VATVAALGFFSGQSSDLHTKRGTHILDSGAYRPSRLLPTPQHSQKYIFITLAFHPFPFPRFQRAHLFIQLGGIEQNRCKAFGLSVISGELLGALLWALGTSVSENGSVVVRRRTKKSICRMASSVMMKNVGVSVNRLIAEAECVAMATKIYIPCIRRPASD